MSAFQNFFSALRGNKERRSPDTHTDDVTNPVKRHTRSQSEVKNKTRAKSPRAKVHHTGDDVTPPAPDIDDVMREKTMSLDRKLKLKVHHFDAETCMKPLVDDGVEVEESGSGERSSSVRKRKFRFAILRRANSLQHAADNRRRSGGAASSSASSSVSLGHSNDNATGSDTKDGMTSSSSTVQSDCVRQLSPIQDSAPLSSEACLSASPDDVLERGSSNHDSSEDAPASHAGGKNAKPDADEKKKKEKKKYRKKRGSFFDIFFHRHEKKHDEESGEEEEEKHEEERRKRRERSEVREENRGGRGKGTEQGREDKIVATPEEEEKNGRAADTVDDWSKAGVIQDATDSSSTSIKTKKDECEIKSDSSREKLNTRRQTADAIHELIGTVVAVAETEASHKPDQHTPLPVEV